MKAPISRIARAPSLNGGAGHILITGGAGFVGSNLAAHFARAGRRVVVFDNLSRAGVTRNADWLAREYGGRVDIHIGDVRDAHAVGRAVQGAHAVFHLAAQVAVTTSLTDPLADFAVNAQGTLNVLEAVRTRNAATPVVFTSTNKVYGALEGLESSPRGRRYVPLDRSIARFGIDESTRLEFHSPYGCSKGCAEQYVLDYARSFDVPAVVLRMSCIYGPRQWGNEDQGWVAHFLRQILARRPIVIYGDGMQVRDLLFVEDLVAALDTTLRGVDSLSGQAFNVGGGPANAVSLVELLSLMGRAFGVEARLRFGPWRQGDQRHYVSDTRRFQDATGWRPSVSVPEGVRRLHQWIREAAREELGLRPAEVVGQ